MTDGGKKGKRLFQTGLIGAVIAALCCFTPILVLLFGALGISVLVGWLDFVLLSALALFLALTLYGLFQMRRAKDD